MAHEFNLPASSIDELKKIIMGYGNVSEKASLDDVARISGVSRTSVSRNAKFLVDTGILNNGAQKSSTELGNNLSRSIEHKVEIDEQQLWQEAVRTNENFSKLVTTLRIKGGMDEKDFCNHIVYVSGMKATQYSKTGARAVLDILLIANMVNDSDGKIEVAMKSDPDFKIAEPEKSKELQAPTKDKETQKNIEVSNVALSSAPQVTINIQLHLPESKDAETYERIFKALKDNLFPPQSGD